MLTHESGSIKYKIIWNQTYDFGRILSNKDKKNECEIQNWCWLPTIIWNIDIKQLNEFYNEIEAGKISLKTNEFKFL